MLALSPVVWLHYFGLLIIPLALWSPSPALWSIPMLLVLVPGEGNGATWQTTAALIVLGLAPGFAWLARESPEPGARARLRAIRAVAEPA